MTVESDLDKGTTLGDADGPVKFIPELGMEVPTFINPRDDLVGSHAKGKYKRVNFHVPFKMRGNFFPHDWPIEFYNTVRGGLHVGADGHVLCHGVNREGVRCGSRAVNRSMWCRSHGGALHPADKKISGSTIVPHMDESRVEKLDRTQRFMQGFLPVSELDDDEIKGQFVRNDQGYPIKSAKLGAKFTAMLRKELHDRLNQFLVSETPDMLKIMTEIARNDLYEAQDRLRAAQWVAEKTMGKAADVLIHANSQDAPYASILDNIEAGSRSEYREKVASQRVEAGEPYEVIDAEIDEEEEEKTQEVGKERDEAEVSEDDALSTVKEIEERRTNAIERAKAIKKAKQRRYAARAVGATTLAGMPWLVEFLAYRYDEKGVRRACDEKDATGYRMKLIPPEKQTQAVIDRLLVSQVKEGEDG